MHTKEQIEEILQANGVDFQVALDQLVPDCGDKIEYYNKVIDAHRELGALLETVVRENAELKSMKAGLEQQVEIWCKRL